MFPYISEEHAASIFRGGIETAGSFETSVFEEGVTFLRTVDIRYLLVSLDVHILSSRISSNLLVSLHIGRLTALH
jgi:hypothetical protein